MSNKEKVSIIIDSNEESQNIQAVEYFVLHEDVEDFTIEPLETGDFIIEDCLFERKTPSDFAQSLQEGRLREQVERMGQEDKTPYIVIEGDMSDFNDLEHTEIPSKSLRGMVGSIMARNNIPVLFCSNSENLVDVSIRIARKSIESVNNVHVKNNDAVQDVPFIVKFFMGIEGVGLNTAEELANEFPSVESVMKADKNKLTAVDGIGDKRAKRIYNTIHESSDGQSENKMTPIKV